MKRKGMWVVASIFGVLALLAGAFGCAQPAPSLAPKATPANVFTMKVSGKGGVGYAPRVLLERFMDLVKDRSGGRIKFEYFSGNSLYGDKEAGEAVSAGIIQLANMSVTDYPDKLGVRAVAHNKPMSIDSKKWNNNYRKGMMPWYQKVFGPLMNWQLLWYPRHGASEIISRVEIRTPEAFKGKLTRCAAAQKRQLELIGLSPAVISSDETFEALQRGTIDASYTTLDQAVSLRWTDVAPYAIIIHYTHGAIAAVMSLNYYNALPSDLRKIIDDASLEVDGMMNALVDANDTKTMAALKANPKVEVITFTRDQLLQLSKMCAPFDDEMRAKYGKEWDEAMDILKRDDIGI